MRSSTSSTRSGTSARTAWARRRAAGGDSGAVVLGTELDERRFLLDRCRAVALAELVRWRHPAARSVLRRGARAMGVDDRPDLGGSHRGGG